MSKRQRVEWLPGPDGNANFREASRLAVGFARLAVSLFARLAECVEAFEFTLEQCFFLRPRPSFELSLAGSGSRKCLEFFDAKERDGWVELSCSTGLAGRVIV